MKKLLIIAATVIIAAMLAPPAHACGPGESPVLLCCSVDGDCWVVGERNPLQKLFAPNTTTDIIGYRCRWACERCPCDGKPKKKELSQYIDGKLPELNYEARDRTVYFYGLTTTEGVKK